MLSALGSSLGRWSLVVRARGRDDGLLALVGRGLAGRSLGLLCGAGSGGDSVGSCEEVLAVLANLAKVLGERLSGGWETEGGS